MSVSAEQLERRHSVRSLRQRAATCGLLLWICNERGRIVSRPALPSAADPLLTARWLTRRIEEAALSWLGGETSAAKPIAPGCWIFPVRLGEVGNRATGVAVAMGLELRCFERDPLPPEWVQAQDVLAPFARRERAELDRLVKILHWCQQDASRIDEQVLAIIDLSRQLSEAYEQMTAVYRIGRAMNNVEAPGDFIQSTCSQLRTLLDFDWIAIQYIDSPNSLPIVRKACFLSGELPCPHDSFSERVLKLVHGWKGRQWMQVLEPGNSDLAALLSCQIVINPLAHDDVLIGALLAGGKRGPENDVTSHDTQLLDVVCEFLGVFHQNALRYEVQRSLFMGTITALSATIDAKDPYTRGHSERVATLATQIGAAIHLSEQELERLHIAGIVHDIGKIGVPESVLCKPTHLTDDEFEIIKKHPTIGYQILKGIPPMQEMLPGVLHHHERWDGKGYPDGLSGHEIPLVARILAVADSFDAMSSDRAYRARMPREKVLSILRENAGAQWDEQIVRAFLTLDLDEYDALTQSQGDARAREAA